MTRLLPALTLAALTVFAQSVAVQPTLITPDGAKWEQEKGQPAGTESITLREDKQTGALELLARYPAGHVFSPHWHSANERVILLEGALAIEVNGAKQTLTPGSYAYLPARQLQRMACTSATRCQFYVYWDSKLDFHSGPVQ